MEMSLSGAWTKVINMFSHAGKKLEQEVNQATIDSGEATVKAIVEHFKNQDLGWKALSAETLKRRKRQERNALKNIGRGEITRRLKALQIPHGKTEKTGDLRSRLIAGGGDMILVVTGTLMSSITFEQKDFKEGSVGINRGARSADGKSVEQIAMVHEFGSGHVPARPFIEPTAREMSPKVKKIYEKAVEKTFKE